MSGKSSELPKNFVELQKKKLLDLRDGLLESMGGIAKENLRNSDGAAGSTPFGQHQADAGSDSYDRDFALNLLSQEQDALIEIEDAIKRVERGKYGVCEISGETIMKERLEAIPFARYTVACQAKIEEEKKEGRTSNETRSIYGLGIGADSDLEQN